MDPNEKVIIILKNREEIRIECDNPFPEEEEKLKLLFTEISVRKINKKKNSNIKDEWIFDKNCKIFLRLLSNYFKCQLDTGEKFWNWALISVL